MRSHRHPRRTVALLVGALLAAAALALPPAYAAAPANDSIRRAVTLTPRTTPYVVSTREATASPSDGECVGGSSVWFRYRPTTTRTLRAYADNSYYTSLAVFTGPRADRTPVACDQDFAPGIEQRFTAGTTYWIAISRCCRDTRKGGRATLYFYEPAPALTVETTIESVVAERVSGQLRVEGTTTCANPSYTETYLTARQRTGDALASGSAELAFKGCGPEGIAWEATVYNGSPWAFHEGEVSVEVDSGAYDGFRTTWFHSKELHVATLDPNARRRP